MSTVFNLSHERARIEDAVGNAEDAIAVMKALFLCDQVGATIYKGSYRSAEELAEVVASMGFDVEFVPTEDDAGVIARWPRRGEGEV